MISSVVLRFLRRQTDRHTHRHKQRKQNLLRLVLQSTASGLLERNR